MIQDIKDYLVKATGDSQGEDLILAIDTLTELGYTAELDQLENLNSITDNSDTVTVITLIRDVIESAYTLLLSNMGITLIEEYIPIEVYIQTMLALKTLETSEDKQSALTICEVAESNEVALAEIVEFYTTLTWSEAIQYYKEVSDALIERIREIAKDEEFVDKLTRTDIVNVSQQKERLLKYTEANKDLIIVEALSAGLKLGMTPNAYIDLYIDQLSPLSPQRLSVELIGILLASNLTMEEINVQLDNFINYIITDANTISKTAIVSRKLLNEVSYVKA